MGDAISNRVAAIEESATIAVSDRARALTAQGHDIISFGAGEPDFPTPPHIVEAAIAAARDPVNHHYSANAGLGPLREAVAADLGHYVGVEVGADSVLITNGGKQAVYQACATLLDPGDEALVPAPYWVTYPEAVTLAGAVPITVPTDGGFRLQLEDLDRARTPQTKLLILVSPSNPTGVVYPREELQVIGRWAAERRLWILTDDIYYRLVYGDARFESVAAATPELEGRWVMINGVSKTYAMTGWRVGWMVSTPEVTKAAGNLQSHLTSNVNNIAQRAALAALTGPQDTVETMREAFDQRRRMMVKTLDGLANVECTEPMGAFYAFPDLSWYADKVGGDIPLANLLLDRAGVAVVPGEAFGAPGYARLSYALGDAQLEQGLDRMTSALEELAS
jgi:aspartate/methionine/tyrosine aminotransferase